MAQVVAQSPSKIEEAILESNDQKRTVDIRTSIVSLDYYEDIFSPTVTAILKMINTGDSIPSANPDGTTDKNAQSVYNGLPLRGGERLRLKVAANTESNVPIDFSKSSKDYLYVSSITDVIAESQRESFTLHLTSREAITNETVRV